MTSSKPCAFAPLLNASKRGITRYPEAHASLPRYPLSVTSQSHPYPSRGARRLYGGLCTLTILRSQSPYAQRGMHCNASEILVGRQHRQPVTDAELREQRVDGADLHAGATATVAKLRRGDVTLRSGPRSGSAVNRSIMSLRARGPAKPPAAAAAGRAPSSRLSRPRRERAAGHRPPALPDPVPAERERPDARVDDEGHRRERSAL